MPYKVVRPDPENPGLFLGAFVNMPYRIGRWVKAPKTLIDRSFGLTYFNSLRLAERFANANVGYLRIFECLVLEEITPPDYGLTMCLNTSLREVISHTDYIAAPIFPLGTKMAKKLKLVKKHKQGI